MSQVRIQTLNSAKEWLAIRHYKVNEVVKKDGFYYQNTTGKNTDPFLQTDWVVCGKIEPLIYDAWLTEVGTDAPTEHYVNRNTVGSIVWSRDSLGLYFGTLSGAFPENKTMPYSFISPNNFNNYIVSNERNDNDTVVVNTAEADTGVAVEMSGVGRPVRVYIEIWP